MKQTARAKRKAHRQANPKKQGRPEIPYSPQYALQVRQVAALGAKNTDIAKVFGVNPNVILKWCRENPEFSNAIKEGRLDPDNRVEASLFRRAIGGDVTACIFWLKCRRPYVWRDRRTQDEADDAGSEVRQRLQNMTSDQLRKFIQSGQQPKQILDVQTKVERNGHK